MTNDRFIIGRCAVVAAWLAALAACAGRPAGDAPAGAVAIDAAAPAGAGLTQTTEQRTDHRRDLLIDRVHMRAYDIDDLVTDRVVTRIYDIRDLLYDPAQRDDGAPEFDLNAALG